jgi:hypothetical protein
MKVRILGVNDLAWRSFLQRADHDFYHLPAYAAVCARQEGAIAGAVHVVDGHRAMLLPILVRRIPGGARDATSPYGYPGPLLLGTGDPAFLADALSRTVGFLRSERIVSLFVRLHPLFNQVPPEGSWAVVQHGHTVAVDLTLPPGQIWRQTRRGHRSDILRATAAGCRVEFDDSWHGFDSFKRLYRDTMLRVSAGSYYLFDDAYFDGLRAALGQRLRLCVVEVDGAIVSSGLFVETGGIVQYHLSASDPDRAHRGVVKLMIDFVRRWATDRGDAWLHLGGGVGGRTRDSLFSFKAGFSPLHLPYWTLRMVVDESAYGRLVGEHNPALDPGVFDEFFPRYRDQ